MTIVYNKNTPDYYLVAGLDQDAMSGRIYGHGTRNLKGDVIVISSDQKVESPIFSSYNKAWKVLKKTLLFLMLISIIPFSTVLATGYIGLLINNEMN